MAINFSNVKAISIPVNGVATEVKSIAINGVIVWQGGRALDSITISGYTTTFNVGDTFSFGGTVIANYDNGDTEDVTNQAIFSGYNMSTAGSQTVTVSFTDNGITKTATYSITVYKVLTKITLSGQTTSLNRGATFSFGGTVTATYNDGSTANVTSSTTFSGYDMSTAGTYTVTASYTYRSVTKTATYSLTVNKVWTTLWSGSKAIQCKGGTVSGASSNFASTANGTGTAPRIRVTFTFAHSISSSKTVVYYNNSNSTTTTKPTSPRDFNTVASTNNLNVLGSKYAGSDYPYTWDASIWLRKANDTTNNRIRFSLGGSNTGSWAYSDHYIKLTVTKIEQYY